jgi:hypothetical protein
LKIATPKTPKPDPDIGKQVREIKPRPCHRCGTETRYIILERRVCVICQINDREALVASEPFIPTTRGFFTQLDADDQEQLLSPYTPVN